jgi:hypothetical protein
VGAVRVPEAMFGACLLETGDVSDEYQRYPAALRRRPLATRVVDGRYVVLPRVVLEHLPLALQQQIVAALAEVHRGTARYPWPPAYRVAAVRWQPVGELVEGELREIGVEASLDTDAQPCVSAASGFSPSRSCGVTLSSVHLCWSVAVRSW